MFRGKIEQGIIEDCPFIRFGQGQEKIVIFPLINDAIFNVWDLRWYFYDLFSAFSRDYTIYVLSRKRQLPIGYSTCDMAHDYARVFKQADLGRVNLLGISLGGMIAQNFAREYPHYVKRLIIVSSAQHMGPEGLKIARRWIPWARLGMWKELYEDTVDLSFHGWYGFLFRLVKHLIIKLFIHKIKDVNVSDFIISGHAGIIHDSSDILDKLTMPALVIGGTQDLFFPETLFDEISEKIPNCELLIIKGAKHLVLEEHRKQCMHEIAAFLRRGEPS